MDYRETWLCPQCGTALTASEAYEGNCDTCTGLPPKEKLSSERPKKIVALTQEEINYVAEHSPDSPTLAMLGNITSLLRSEVRRINAEYIITSVTIGGGAIDQEGYDLIKKWKEARK